MKPFQAKFPAIEKVGLSIEQELERQGDLNEMPLLLAADRWREAYDSNGADESALCKIDDLAPDRPGLITCLCPLELNKGLELLLLALPQALSENNGRLLFVGSGPFREGLELILEALDVGDGMSLELAAAQGSRLVGQMKEPLVQMRRFLRSLKAAGDYDQWLERCETLDLYDRVRFVGHLGHELVEELKNCSSLLIDEVTLSGKSVKELVELLES